jgi:hypothetical protein
MVRFHFNQHNAIIGAFWAIVFSLPIWLLIAYLIYRYGS